MTASDRYQRAKAIFHRIRDLPEAEQLAAAEADCGGEVALLEEVLSLLRADADADTGFLAQAPEFRQDGSIDTESLGRERGWRVVRELGRGGMGVVFLGERADGAYRQQVAIKLLQAGALQGDEAILRLKLERQILARLKHPGIARLLDGGTAANGAPYLVMEYVEGQRIDRWCAQHALGLADRLQLFLKVCDAVAYAHRNLVVHRDLKPDNILVGADGQPKLLDFGIARQLDTTAMTQEGSRLLTPRYASPEQVRGEPVSTLSDVYSLGVVLYELLTGRSPYGDVVSVPHRLAAVICDTDADPPSRSLMRRSSEQMPEDSIDAVDPGLANRLRGDLDAIVLRCLRKPAEQRYASVEALIEDVRAHLDGRPVDARAGERAYRIARFAARHRLTVATIAGVAVLTVAFVVQLSLQLRQTEQERARAVQAEARAQIEARSALRARDFLVSLFAATGPAQTLGEPIRPEVLLERARAQVTELDDAPEVAASLLLAIARTYAALGMPADSAESAEAALALLPAVDSDLLLRAQALEALAMASVKLGRYGRAHPLLEEMSAIHARELAGQPERLARSYLARGQAAQLGGELRESMTWFDRAMALVDTSSDASAEDQLVILVGSVVSASVLGELDVAAERLQQAEAVAERLDPRHPVRIDLLIAAANLSRRSGEYEDSLQRLQQAESMAEYLLGLQTEVLAQIYNDLGVSYRGLGRYQEAIAIMQRARLAYAGFEEAAADIDANLGAIHESLEQYPQAIAYARAALAVQERDPQGNQHTIRQVRSNLAQALSFSGEHETALELMREAVAASAIESGQGGFQHVLDRFRLAAALRRAGHTEAAAEEFAIAGPALTELLNDPDHPFNFYPMRLEAGIAGDAGQTDTAKAGLAAAIKFADEHPGADPGAVAIARIELAELLAIDNPEAAREVLAPALVVLEEALDEEAPSRRWANTLAIRLGMR